MKYYIIASIQRTGSNLLRHLLETVKVGRPCEMIYEVMEENIETVYLKGKSNPRSEIWGATFHWSHWERALAKLREITSHDSDDFQMLNDTFPGLKFIYLYRLNKIKQAISWVRARQTGQWQYPHNESVKEGEYNEVEIDKILMRINLQQVSWQNFFDTYNIRPHFVAYEELCENRIHVISGILKFLGCPLRGVDKINGMQMPIKKQYDAVSEEWYQRFIKNKRCFWD